MEEKVKSHLFRERKQKGWSQGGTRGDGDPWSRRTSRAFSLDNVYFL